MLPPIVPAIIYTRPIDPWLQVKTHLFNHQLGVTTQAIDIGAFTPFLWGFEEREILMSFYEAISGARIHAAYLRPGGISVDVPLYWIDQI